MRNASIIYMYTCADFVDVFFFRLIDLCSYIYTFSFNIYSL